MKIILIKGVNKLGKKGEVKEVSRGFALNYLLPNNLAVHYTEKAKKKYQTDLTVEEQSEKWKKEKIDSTVNKIKNTVLTFSQKADEKGTFFAGVSKEDLVKA
ncbi:MAG TPA: 50S ribosomal protein L9, partial [Patescibacteria group bacterium]|nr:50S ribosomal protein L9 [Patescibacteria group bacterium]